MLSGSEKKLVTNDNNPGSVGTQTENSFSKDSLEQKIESLRKEIKSLRKQNQLNSGIIRLGVIGLIGYIIATTNWSAIAPASAAIAAAAPVIGIVIGTIIGAAVLVGASYAAWRYRAEIKAGFKYAAEKTVEGAKHIAGKIKAGALYAKNSVKEAASSLKQATREGTSSALKKMGEGVQNLGRKISDRGASISDLESIPYSTQPQEPQDVVLLTKRELDPNLIDSNSNGNLERGSLQSNSLSRGNSVSSLDSISIVSSTAGLLNPKEHKKAPTSAKDKVLLPWFRRTKEEKGTTKVKYQVLSEPGAMQSATVNHNNLSRSPSSSRLYDGPPVPTPVVPPKAPGSPTSSRDSGINSDSSTPEERSPSLKEEFDKELAEKLKKRRSSVDQLSVEPVNLRVEVPGAGN